MNFLIDQPLLQVRLTHVGHQFDSHVILVKQLSQSIEALLELAGLERVCLLLGDAQIIFEHP